MRTKRDRRLTPICTSLTAGWDEAIDREAMAGTDFYLKAKGHLENKEVEKSKS